MTKTFTMNVHSNIYCDISRVDKKDIRDDNILYSLTRYIVDRIYIKIGEDTVNVYNKNGYIIHLETLGIAYLYANLFNKMSSYYYKIGYNKYNLNHTLTREASVVILEFNYNISEGAINYAINLMKGMFGNGNVIHRGLGIREYFSLRIRVVSDELKNKWCSEYNALENLVIAILTLYVINEIIGNTDV